MKNKYMENEHLSLILFLILALVYCLTYMTKNCYSAAMVLLVDEGILTKTQTGTISAMFYFVYAVFQIPGGFAADKYSPYHLIAIGLIGAAFANMMIIFTDNYYVMMAVWSFNAAVQFGIWPSIFKIVSTCLAPAHRHNAIFYITFSSTAGSVLSYLIAGLVSGWRSNFKISAAVLFACFALWVISGKYMEKNMVDEEPLGHGVAHLPEHKKDHTTHVEGVFALIVKSGLVILLPVIMLQSLFSVGMQSVIPSMLTENYDSVSPSVASVLNVFPILVGILGKYVMQFFYRKKAHNEALSMMICLFVMVAPLFAMTFVGKISVWFIVAMVSSVLLISNASSILSTSYIPVRFSSYGRTATVSGLVNAMASLGIVMANYVSPRIADSFGWIEVVIAWIMFATAAALISLIAFIPWKCFILKSKP